MLSVNSVMPMPMGSRRFGNERIMQIIININANPWCVRVPSSRGGARELGRWIFKGTEYSNYSVSVQCMYVYGYVCAVLT